jgi:hypothetical protein
MRGRFHTIGRSFQFHQATETGASDTLRQNAEGTAVLNVGPKSRPSEPLLHSIHLSHAFADVPFEKVGSQVEVFQSQVFVALSDQLTPSIPSTRDSRTLKSDPASLIPYLIHDKSVICGSLLDAPRNATCFSIADEREDCRSTAVSNVHGRAGRVRQPDDEKILREMSKRSL